MKFLSKLFCQAKIQMDNNTIRIGYDGSALKNDSIFRRKFKFYKQRMTEPDLSDVLELNVSNPKVGVICQPVNCLLFSENDKNYIKNSLNFRKLDEWTITTLKHRPGLYILGNVFTRRYQLEWIQNALLRYSEPPNVTNLSALGTYCDNNVFRTCGKKLRWVTMGNDYNWSQKEYPDKPRQALPNDIIELGGFISRILELGEMNPDATIINFYPEKAYLSPHVDRSERDMSRPLISLSFGQSIVYLTGGETLDDPVDALFLHSGNILVMHSKQRGVYHSVARVVNTTVFESDLDWNIESDVLNFANNCRVNVTIRQVDS